MSKEPKPQSPSQPAAPAAPATAAPAVVNLVRAANYASGAIVSKTLADKGGGTITLFAFDAGQALSEHTTPFDAHVLILDGTARLTIGGAVVKPSAGEWVVMPANVPHAVYAPVPFKMLLIMLRAAPQRA